MEIRDKLLKIYNHLYHHFGPLNWWPGDTPFEIMIGAILTQNTSWRNVEKTIKNLKEENLLNPKKLNGLDQKKLIRLIRPSGYYNVKAKRLKNFLTFYIDHYEASAKKMFSEDAQELRRKLLTINGIGAETADSILLYAGKKPFFVVDAYTKRVFFRHKLISEDSSYHKIQEFFMQNLPHNVELFNEFHAQIVMLGKNICTNRNPKCLICPIHYLRN